jgi:pyridoxal phosphate enzyme (YggS family)
LQEIDKQAAKNNRVIECLLQVHIAREETKYGLDEKELDEITTRLGSSPLPNIKVKGLMGMASFVENSDVLKNEFHYLKTLFDKYARFLSDGSKNPTLSMGMSSDYKVAISEGSNMVRIGSLIFGERSG